MYLGHRNSVLYYNAGVPSWVWYDRKDSRSVAVSNSPEASLFLGVPTFYFSQCVERCSLCGLFRGTRQQVPNWGWTISGESSYPLMIRGKLGPGQLGPSAQLSVFRGHELSHKQDIVNSVNSAFELIW